MRNLIQAGVPQSVAMKISGHRDARVFARYNIVDTRDVAEAMRKVSQYEQEKRLARAKQMIDVQSSPQTANVHNTFTEANFEPQNPALPEKLQ